MRTLGHTGCRKRVGLGKNLRRSFLVRGNVVNKCESTRTSDARSKLDREPAVRALETPSAF